MNKEHPITPPPELVQRWINEENGVFAEHIATQAARWGSDQELEACCEWFQEFYKTESWVKHDLKHFRAARRPKSPSLKAGAIEVLDELDGLFELPAGHYNTILRALEQLDDSL
jgi:hypothetical protein